MFRTKDMVMVKRARMVEGIKCGKLVQKDIGPMVVLKVLSKDGYEVRFISSDPRRFKGVVASNRLKLFEVQTIDD